MAFSESFQKRLSKSVCEANIGPIEFLKMFEDYVNEPNNDMNNIFYFKLPNHIKDSPNKYICLTTLQQELEKYGFKKSKNISPNKAEYVFVKDTFNSWHTSYPHRETSTIEECTKIIIHL